MPLIIMNNDPYRNKSAVHNLLNYIMRNAYIVGGLAIDPKDAEFQMQLVKDLYFKTEGRQIRHFIVALADNEELELDELYAVAQKIALYYADRYQIVFGIHIGTNHTHIHFALNTVSYVDGRMYREGYGDYIKLKTHVGVLFPGSGVELAGSSLEL